MRFARFIAILTLSALALSGCDEDQGLAGVGARKGVYAGAPDTPLPAATRAALGKRAQLQNFGL